MDFSKYVKQRQLWLTSRLKHLPQSDVFTYSIYRNLRSSFLIHKQKNQQINNIKANLSSKPRIECLFRKRISILESSSCRIKFPTAYCEETATPTGSKDCVVPPDITDEDIQNYLTNQQGWDRVKQLYSRKETLRGGISPELDIIILVTSVAMFTSGVMFGRLSFYRAMEEFAVVNKRNHYASRKIYRQLMHEYGMKEMASKGTLVGSKVGLLVGLFLCVSESISTYRGKTSMLEYCVGGAVSGSLIRWYHGVRGMALGGILGTLFGVIGGGGISASLHFLDQTQEKRLYEKTKLMLEKQRQVEIVRATSGLNRLEEQS